MRRPSARTTATSSGPSWYADVASDRFCLTCGVPLESDDIALYMKLISRMDRRFVCLDCLGRRLNCERETLEKLIAYYRQSGRCVLFR